MPPAPAHSAEFEDLLDFVYAVPEGLLRFRRDGQIDMLNPVAVNLLMSFFGAGEIENIYDTFRTVATDLTDEVTRFRRPRGVIVDRRHFDRATPDRPFTLSLSVFMVRPDQFMAILTDATQSVAVMRQLQDSVRKLEESNHLLQRAEALAHIGNWRIAIDPITVRWSDETFRIFGRPIGPMPSLEDMLQGLHADDRAAAEHRLRQAIAAGEAVGFTARVVRPGGDIRIVTVHGEVEYDSEGRLSAVLGTLQDTTDQTEIENQLRHRQKVEAIGRFAAGVAHDFNNLLCVITLALDIAGTLITDQGETKALLDEAFAAAESGAALTGSLLAFGRNQSQPSAQLDLNAVVTMLHRLFSRVLGSDVHLVLDLQPTLWPIQADLTQLEACITNFVTNARDAMPKGGTLTIRTGHLARDAADMPPDLPPTPADWVMLAVTDTGIGMSAELIARIFEPFFTTKPSGAGTGLGLSLVFNFARQFGGHVSVNSAPGCGTTMTLLLPRAIMEAETDQPIPLVRPAHLAKGNGEVVLVVEDNVAMRRIVLQQLSGLNYLCLEAEDAAAALAVMERERVDLLFTDIEMPGDLNGLGLTAQVRTRWPATRALLTSALSFSARSELRGNRVADTALLRKPYNLMQLAEAVHEAITVSPRIKEA